jgi:hypothetical protein
VANGPCISSRIITKPHGIIIATTCNKIPLRTRPTVTSALLATMDCESGPGLAAAGLG